MCGTTVRWNWEISSLPTADGAGGPHRAAERRTSVTHGLEKSDRLTVPKKRSNKAEPAAAERAEGRSLAKGNPVQGDTNRIPRRGKVNRALGRRRQAAARNRQAKFTSLLHHIYSVDRLREAYFSLKREAAPGVDGETWRHYGAELAAHLQDLSGRLARGAYRASPAQRGYVPKPDGRQRPIGVPVLQDKVVQRAAVAVLNQIYETECLGFWYGFRPGRGQHDALAAVETARATKNVNDVLDADIRGFFDAIWHEWTVKFVEHRIGDERVVRLIQKWLKAGVLEDGTWTQVKEGTPHGGSASPLLANLYRHYVCDLWLPQGRTKRARGDVIVVRCCDDFMVGFQYRSDAEQFLAGAEGTFPEVQPGTAPGEDAAD
jgi:RNA-directed DNA polymerase